MDFYFITGTSRGIGKALSEEILKLENTHVTGISRKNNLNHNRYTHIFADLSKISEAEKIDFKLNMPKNPNKLILINNSASIRPIKYIGGAESQDIIDSVILNFAAPALLTNNFMKAFSSLSCPKIILNIGSGASKNVYDGWSIYCATKAALHQFSEVVSKESKIRNNNTHVFVVAPGIIDTMMQDEIRMAKDSDFSKLADFHEYKKSGLLATPEKIAKKLLNIIATFETRKETQIWL